MLKEVDKKYKVKGVEIVVKLKKYYRRDGVGSIERKEIVGKEIVCNISIEIVFGNEECLFKWK